MGILIAMAILLKNNISKRKLTTIPRVTIKSLILIPYYSYSLSVYICIISEIFMKLFNSNRLVSDDLSVNIAAFNFFLTWFISVDIIVLLIVLILKAKKNEINMTNFKQYFVELAQNKPLLFIKIINFLIVIAYSFIIQF